MPDDTPSRGSTPNELARLLRKSPDWIRARIRAGELAAINTAPRNGRPRFVVLPEQLAAFLEGRRVSPPPPKPARRRKPRGFIDFYPD
jgi:hypothetical protein